MELLKFEITPGQEIMTTLEEKLKEKNVKNGAIVSMIGAFDECQISTMPPDDAQKNIMHEYKQPLELSGTGEINEGKVHIHCTLGKEDGTAVAGHLHWGKVQSWFVNVFVLVQ